MQHSQRMLNSEDITAQDALLFVDDALFRALGRRLNDLEINIFVGSWEGRTYEEIYPLNPEYVEKSVGYKLWKKLSVALGEKVSKKRIRGAVMRHYSPAEIAHSLGEEFAGEIKVAIIWQREPSSNEQTLMHALSSCLERMGCHVQTGASEHKSVELKSLQHNHSDWLSEIQDVDVLVVAFSDDTAAAAGVPA